ncbi:hypothetical protein S83_055807, partial [Arachis hypogaea]
LQLNTVPIRRHASFMFSSSSVKKVMNTAMHQNGKWTSAPRVLKEYAKVKESIMFRTWNLGGDNHHNLYDPTKQAQIDKFM